MANERHAEGDFPLSVLKRFDDIFERFEVVWSDGGAPSLTDYLYEFEGETRARLLRHLLEIDVHYRVENGQTPTCEFYERLLPGDTTLIREEFDWNGWEDSQPPTIAADAGTDERPEIENEPNPLPEMIDRFQVMARLGRGGFGLVCRCWDPNLGEDVAVKIPRPDRDFSEQEIENFLQEASKATKLRKHAGIVGIREAQHRGKDSFIVSDYIQGKSLAERMKEKPFSPEEAARIIAAVADALHHAHRQGLVHRDVKPGNILLDENDKPYLTDFGMAAAEDEQFAEGAGIRGTPMYLSPEQARGESHLAGPTADIFALGVVFYEMLAGVRPFRGKTRVEVLEKIKSSQPPRSIRDHKGDVPAELEEICLKCLRKNAEQRYASASDLAMKLREYVPPETRVAKAKTTVWLVPICSILALAVLMMILVLVMNKRQPDTNHQTNNEKLDVMPKTLTPGIPYSLFRHAPKLLAWRGTNDELFIKQDTVAEKMTIVAKKPALIQLAWIDKSEFNFQIDFECANWDDRIAIFLGFHQDAQTPTIAKYQLLELLSWGQHPNKKYYCYRRKVWDHFDSGGDPRALKTWKGEPLREAPQSRHRFSLTVSQQGLTSVRWDSQLFEKLSAAEVNETFSPEYYLGPIGIMVGKSTVFVRDAKLERFE